jgi:hypothetical protein
MKKITTPQGIIVVDESAEIKEDDWFYNDWCKGIFINQYAHKATLNNYSNAVHLPDNQFLQNKSNCYKIIDTINHSISLDVPMVIVEDAVEKEANTLYKKYCEDKNIDYHLLDSSVFYLGYKASQQKGYSEEDLRKAISMAICAIDPTIIGSAYYILEENKIINSLKQESIELDMEVDTTEIDNCNKFNRETGCILPHCKCEDGTLLKIKTNRVNGQLMAYIKK